MSSYKRDFNTILKLFIDLTNNLTEDQFKKLVSGTADIKYYEKSLDSGKKEKYNNIIYVISNTESMEKKKEIINNNSELSTKAKLLELCKYFKIDCKVKDTKDHIISNIIEYARKNKENILYKYDRLESIEITIDQVAKKLEQIMDIKEAKRLINNTEIFENKSNLLKLSKKLGVFNDRESSHEGIVDNIVKSVVESKIRSYTIRKKM